MILWIGAVVANLAVGLDLHRLVLLAFSYLFPFFLMFCPM